MRDPRPPAPEPRSPVLLSVIVITRNEAPRLGRCLQSVALADEVIVVDSGSTDGTPDIARAHGATVVETTDWPGFGPQKQRALDAAHGRWVLSLDADEWLDDGLAEAVRRVVQAPADGAGPAGYELSRLSAFCGQWMRASGWYPDLVLRLVRRDRARFTADLVHERLTVDGPVERLSGGELLHDTMASLEDAIDKMNRYSSGRARDLAARGRQGGLGRAVAHGLWAFLRTFVLRRGFRDGRLGFVLAVHNAETTYYRYLKLWLGEGDRLPPVPPAVERR
ncbi:glycosyltransferase family 2 protein [Aquabacterium sp. J223]|uniref:glycosyltransferase family 2 protein n=1 Tax=Aquabacterium sp. J223 TaxID=2898431 RepID=UPI0021AD87CF|nr:glycosyltransferase family 2 protein [Aquabacterium sp. J223]UUX97512.1 glycosyltransferase family 2 protein [Aquabacterium sp. J223]